jgi:aerobic carbon-monoxide dehydrogenase small subunit
MIFEFTLNGSRVKIDVEPTSRLVDVLHDTLHLEHTKAGCYAGECGTCAILLDGELVLSCLVPMFVLRNRSVITIEGIESTRTYRELNRAFDEAGYYPCHSCFQAKLLSLYHLLETIDAPVQSEIDEIMLAQRCRCTDYTDLSEILSRLIVRRRKRRRATRI